MKKIIAMVMALVMLMAIAVPAFAGEITNTATAPGEALVKTDTSAVGAGSYVVSYPAVISIPWDAPTYDVTYDVETQLAVGKTLNVAVADRDTTTLVGTMTAPGTTDTLVYDLSGDVSVDYDEVKTETETITFTVRDWNKTIAEYSNYITFTATLADKA